MRQSDHTDFDVNILPTDGSDLELASYNLNQNSQAEIICQSQVQDVYNAPQRLNHGSKPVWDKY